jgi:hypothetical protein
MNRLILVSATAMALSLYALASAQPAQPADPSAGSSQPYPSEQPMPAPSAPATPAQSEPGPSDQSSQADPSSAAPAAGDPSEAQSSAQAQAGSAHAEAQAAGPPVSANTRLAAIVPSGMTPQQACMGFDSVSECAATLHAAQNLNLPYPGLKAKVTGGENLTKAIHDLAPSADAQAEAAKATEQAHADLRPAQG